MRRFMNGDFDHGMLDILVSCVHCGNEFEIKVDSIEGLFALEECCSVCMRQNHVTLGIQDGDLVRLDVSVPDGDY